MRRLAISAALLAMLAPVSGSGTAAAGGGIDFDWNGIQEGETKANKKASRKKTAYELYMREGDLAVSRIPIMGRTMARGAGFKKAVVAYASAAELEPTRAEPHYRLAELINAVVISDRAGVSKHWSNTAIAHWKEFERLTPLDPRMEGVLSVRSLAYTKLNTAASLKLAVVDYENLLKIRDFDSTPAGESARLLSNMAEVHMMAGRLPRAIELYERALTYQQKPLYAFGLAVALDRSGQGIKAREIMSQYATVSTRDGFMSQLNSRNVFFVPPGEVHYYFALIGETLGTINHAIVEYKKFIKSGAHPTFHARARANIRHLERLKRSMKGKKTPPPRWWARWSWWAVDPK